MRTFLQPVAVLFTVLLSFHVLAGEVAFNAKPTATKEGDAVVIKFSVSGATDVAVFVEDAKGKIVRHLVAGVLGGEQAPPEPLKPGLSQSIPWDGKADYGKPAEGGPFKVRVALGLKVNYDRVLSSRPLSFAGTCALGAGPDGTLYLRHQYSPSVWRHTQVLAINRDGSYRRTLLPYAATPGNAEAKGIDTMTIDGRLVPAGRAYERDLFNEIAGPNYSNLAVGSDGKNMYGLAGNGGLMCISTSGGCTEGPLVSNFEKEKNGLGKEPALFGTGFIALATDGKRAFVNGLSNRYAPAPLPAVYAVSLADRASHTVFFGDPKQAGNDQTHLSASPGMLAIDGKGNLLVADSGNGRVLVLAEADGKFVGEFKTETPRGLGVDRRTGAIYVTSEKGNKILLRKFNGWKDEKPASEILLDRKGWTPNHSMALDASSNPPLVWVAGGGDGQLLRVEDRGAAFERTEISADWRQGQPQECYLSVVVDRMTKEIYTRNGGSGGIWERFNDDTGAAEIVKLPGNAWSDGGGKGTQISPAPNGRLYGIKWEHSFFQWDRNGKPLAWEEPRIPSDQELKSYDYDKAVSKDPSVSYVPVGMTELPHTLGVRWGDGHLFVLEPCKYGTGGRTFKALHEYLPSGKRVTPSHAPILWKISDGAVGPKFDAAGNIYIAEFVRPKGWYYPTEVKAYLDGKGVTKLQGKTAQFTSMYGSILKFSSKGGTVHWPRGGNPDGSHTSNEGAWAGPDPFEGELKLDPALKTMDAEFYSWDQVRPVKVTGAEWMHPGVGNVGMFRCNCENITFDVDEFGRTFFPDLPGFRIVVLDSSGNELTKFGGYGNPENRGPDSPVVDPKTGELRERRASDPKDLKSPFADPDIALAWPAGVGVTDKHAYIGDAINRRLLRCKMTYAAEAQCSLP